jgi:hypothetical protein
MSRSVCLSVVFLMAFAIAGPLPSASACFECLPGGSYANPSPCGKYMFVMIDPRQAPEVPDEVAKEYPASGLYLLGGPNIPLWTVDWYSYEGTVKIASDGVHLIRTDWGDGEKPAEIAFYARGRLLRAYLLSDLVEAPVILHHMMTGSPWEYPEGEIDEQRLHYRVETAGWNRFVFDMRTGDLIWESRPFGFVRQALLFIIVPCTLLFAVLVCVRLRERLAGAKKQAEQGEPRQTL